MTRIKGRKPGKEQRVAEAVSNVCLGVIEADCLYTREQLKRRGISAAVLSEARRSKIVRAIEIGKRRWYYGRQIIDWMLTLTDTGKRKLAPAGSGSGLPSRTREPDDRT